MRAKRNFRAPKGLTPTQVAQGKRKAADWHWYPEDEFENQLEIVEWDDPDYPPGELIECGRLARLHFRAPDNSRDRHPRRKRDTTIALNMEMANQSHLAFDPNHADERLYLLMPAPVCIALKARFWGENTAPSRSLAEWATLAGGRHGKRAHVSPADGGYPQLMGKPVGILTAVVYWTNKEGDGPSFYIHRMGEVSCYLPILACDPQGRLWVCGGNYLAPTPGITD